MRRRQGAGILMVRCRAMRLLCASKDSLAPMARGQPGSAQLMSLWRPSSLGAAWAVGRAMEEQVAWRPRADLMNVLVDEGFVLLGLGADPGTAWTCRASLSLRRGPCGSETPPDAGQCHSVTLFAISASGVHFEGASSRLCGIRANTPWGTSICQSGTRSSSNRTSTCRMSFMWTLVTKWCGTIRMHTTIRPPECQGRSFSTLER
jgi:hypothetical protein